MRIDVKMKLSPVFILNLNSDYIFLLRSVIYIINLIAMQREN